MILRLKCSKNYIDRFWNLVYSVFVRELNVYIYYNINNKIIKVEYINKKKNEGVEDAV